MIAAILRLLGDAHLIVIPPPRKLSPPVRYAPQLACVNRKIAERVTYSSNAHVHAIFAEAVSLAGKANRGSNGAATNARRKLTVSSVDRLQITACRAQARLGPS